MWNPFRRKEKSLQQPAARGLWTSLISYVREPFAGAWQRNMEINDQTVLSFHAVFACISLIASDISKMPLRQMRRDKNGIWKETNAAPQRKFTGGLMPIKTECSLSNAGSIRNSPAGIPLF